MTSQLTSKNNPNILLLRQNFYFLYSSCLILSYLKRIGAYCSTTLRGLSLLLSTKLDKMYKRSIFTILNIKLKNLSTAEQYSYLRNYNLLPLQLRLFCRLNTFIFTLLKLNTDSFLYNLIFSNKNSRGNLILPKCHTDIIKYSFTTIAIKLINNHILKHLDLSTFAFKSAMIRDIFDIYTKSVDFFT